MTFAWPLVLLLVPAWLAWAWRAGRREAAAREASLAALGRRDVLTAFGRLPDPVTAARRWMLRAAAIAVALVALARPQGPSTPRTGESMGRDVLVALDLSRSMTVRDVGEGRLRTAKTAALEIVNALDAGDRAGLVVFGGSGFLQLPLTPDRDAFERFLAAVTVELLDDPSTDVTAPLGTARTYFAHEDNEGHRAVLLLSDGDDEYEADYRSRAIAEAAKANIPVFTVGVGTATGGLVPRAPDDTTGGPSNPWHVDGVGRPVESRLQAGPLRELAEGTGGRYAAVDDAGERAALLEGLRAITQRPLGSQRRAEPTEWFQLPLGLALLLLVMATGVRVPARRLGVAAVLLLVVQGCADGRLVLDAGTRRYAKGDHEGALAAWMDDLKAEATPALHYNVGSALYRLARYERAADEFAEAAAEDGPLRTRALFNLGTAALRAAEKAEQPLPFYDRAIESLQRVLLRTPGDSLARWNLEIALRRRGEVDTGGSPGRGGRANAGRSGGKEEGLADSREAAVAAMAGGGSGDMEGESAQEIDEQEARKQLDALEREMLSTHEGRQSKRGARSDRDW